MTSCGSSFWTTRMGAARRERARPMQHLIQAFVQHLKSQSARTAKLYGNIVAKFFAGLAAPTAPPTGAEIDLFLDRPRLDGGPRRATTINQELAALRVFTKFAEKRGAPGLPVYDVRFRKEPRRDPVFLTEDEENAWYLAAHAEPDPWRRARDLAISAVALQAGLRVSELVGLDVNQVDQRALVLPHVQGKGQTSRTVKINRETAALLASWLAIRSLRAREGEDAVFVSTRGTRITARTVERLFVALRPRSGILKKATPHTGRHTLGTSLLVRGAALDAVADVLGHRSLETTRIYSHLVDVRARQAINDAGARIPRDVLAEHAHPPIDAEALTKNVPANDNETLDGQHGLSDSEKRCAYVDQQPLDDMAAAA